MESWMSDEDNKPKYRQQNIRNIQYSFGPDGKRKVWRNEDNKSSCVDELESRIAAPSRLDPRLSKTSDIDQADIRKDPRLNPFTKKDEKERNSSFEEIKKDPRINSYLEKIRTDSPNSNKNFDNENKRYPMTRKDPRLAKDEEEDFYVKEKRGPRSPPSPPDISNSSRKWRRDSSDSSSPESRREKRETTRRDSSSPRRSRRRSRSMSPMQQQQQQQQQHSSWKPSSPPQPPPPPPPPAPPPPRFNHPPPRQYNNAFNEGGYNNNYGPPQSQGYGFPPQQTQNYNYGNYYQQPMYQQGYPPPTGSSSAQPWQNNNMFYPEISQQPLIAPPPPSIVQPPTAVPPPLDKNAEEAKKEAGVEKEMLNQQQTLVKQREEYVRKSLLISRELKLLKEQERDLLEENSKENVRFLKENNKLQVEIQTRLKAINNVIDMLTGIIGDGKRSSKLLKEDDNKPDSPPESFENHFLTSNLTSNPISEIDKSHDSNGYIYFDPENHWCRVCNVFPKTAKDFLNHLHTQEHKINLQENKLSDMPWHNLTSEKEAIPPKGLTNKRVPIRGIQFFISATSWFCKLCNTWMGDLHCASLHLKSKIHSDNYEAHLDKNPKWESDWLQDRGKALERGPNESEDIFGTNKKKKDKSKNKKKKSSDDKKKKRSKKRAKSKKIKKSSDSSSSGSSSSSSSSESSDEESYKEDEGDENGLRSIRVAMRNKATSRTSLTSDNESKWHSIQDKRDEEKEQLEQEVKEMQKKIRQVKEWEEKQERELKMKRFQEEKIWSSPEEKQLIKEKFRPRQEFEREKDRRRDERERERERYYERKNFSGGRRRSESPPLKRYRDDRSPDERRYRRDYERSPKREYRRYEEYDRPEPVEKKFDKPPGPIGGVKPKKIKKPPAPPTQLNIPKSKLPFIGRMPVLKNLAKKKENEKSDDNSPKEAEVRTAVTISGPAKTEVQDMEIDDDSNGGEAASPSVENIEDSAVHYESQAMPEEEYVETENSSLIQNVNPSGFETENQELQQPHMPMMNIEPPPVPQEMPPEKKDIPLPQDFQEALNIIFPGQKIPGDKQHWQMGPNGVMIPTGYQSLDGQIIYDAYGNSYCPTQDIEGEDGEDNESNSEETDGEGKVAEEEEEELGEDADKLKPELDGVDDLALLGIDAEDLAAQSF